MSLSAPYRLTALVSCYNASGLLRGCLDDLIGQTLYRLNQLEIIVIDSGSAENEHEIVAAYQTRHPHIRLLRTEKETVYAAWNRGIQAARGRYITNANTDDAHRTDALEILSGALENHPQADLAYSHCAFTRRPNDAFPSASRFLDCRFPAFTPALGMFYCLLGPHPVWRKTVFDKIGWFDPNFSNAGDYDFQMRFIQAGLQAVWVPEILSLFYQNPNGLSLGSDKTLIESKTIENRYRATVPIARLYPIGAGDAQAEAAGLGQSGKSGSHVGVCLAEETEKGFPLCAALLWARLRYPPGIPCGAPKCGGLFCRARRLGLLRTMGQASPSVGGCAEGCRCSN